MGVTLYKLILSYILLSVAWAHRTTNVTQRATSALYLLITDISLHDRGLRCCLTSKQHRVNISYLSYNSIFYLFEAVSGYRHTQLRVGKITYMWARPSWCMQHCDSFIFCVSCQYKLDMYCDFSSNNNIWARFNEFLWRPFRILLGYFFYDRLIEISRISFLAVILNWNFRLRTSNFSKVTTELFHF